MINLKPDLKLLKPVKDSLKTIKKDYIVKRQCFINHKYRHLARDYLKIKETRVNKIKEKNDTEFKKAKDFKNLKPS